MSCSGTHRLQGFLSSMAAALTFLLTLAALGGHLLENSSSLYPCLVLFSETLGLQFSQRVEMGPCLGHNFSKSCLPFQKIT